MAMSTYATAQDLVDALSVDTFMAIFDDARIGDVAAVMTSTGVASCLRAAHTEIASRLPAIYSQVPAEQPNDSLVSDLLRVTELKFATIYAYRRHPEYVRTFGAGPNGPLWQEALDATSRIQVGDQRIPANDNPPEPVPENVGGIVYDQGPRLLVDKATGEPTSGDF